MRCESEARQQHESKLKTFHEYHKLGNTKTEEVVVCKSSTGIERLPASTLAVNDLFHSALYIYQGLLPSVGCRSISVANRVMRNEYQGVWRR